MPVPQRVPEFLFRLLIPLGGLFVITVLGLVMLPFSEARAPIARLLDAYGGRLIAAEVTALAVVGLLALTTDRLSALSQQQSEAESRQADSGSSPSAEIASHSTDRRAAASQMTDPGS